MSRRTAPAALRNREPIATALAELLPKRGTVLELGSGTGEHAIYLSRRFPHLTWQPSDPDPVARASIASWAKEAPVSNLLPPLDLDLRAPTWRRRPAAALLCVNVLHVTPWDGAEALCAGAALILPPGGPLLVYGPFSHRGVSLRGRLARFDGELRTADAALGVREVEALVETAAAHGLSLADERRMPEEGDLLLALRRTP